MCRGRRTGCSYTVGYFGRIIQAKNLSKGGSFESNDEGFLRFKLGEGLVIPAFEEALYGMKVGGIRRILVPPGPLSVRMLPVLPVHTNRQTATRFLLRHNLAYAPVHRVPVLSYSCCYSQSLPTLPVLRVACVTDDGRRGVLLNAVPGRYGLQEDRPGAHHPLR